MVDPVKGTQVPRVLGVEGGAEDGEERSAKDDMGRAGGCICFLSFRAVERAVDLYMCESQGNLLISTL
jgi:hypothetical protein